MANIEEIALGITTVLNFAPQPEPLGVELRGQTPDEIRCLIEKVIDECADADQSIAAVRADANLLLKGGFEHRGVHVERHAGLWWRVEFYRQTPVATTAD